MKYVIQVELTVEADTRADALMTIQRSALPHLEDLDPYITDVLDEEGKGLGE